MGLALGAVGCGDQAATNKPAAPGTARHVDQRDPLRGLDALRVNPSFAQVTHASLTKDPALVADVEQRLTAAGLRVLTAEEFAQQPGAAELQIYPSVNGGLANPDQPPGPCCLASVWVSVIEGVTLDRPGQPPSRLPIWGVGSNRGCADGPASVRDLVLETVDRFVSDRRKANESPAAPSGGTGATAP